MDVEIIQDPTDSGINADGDLFYSLKFMCPPGITAQDVVEAGLRLSSPGDGPLEGSVLIRDVSVGDGENIISELEAGYADLVAWLSRFGHTAQIPH